MARHHIVNYDENRAGDKSRAKCTCGATSAWISEPATDTWARLDQWAEDHIEEVER